MSNAISIALDPYPGYEPAAAGQPLVYSRGAHITGTVYIEAIEPIKARAVELDLRWQTSGKGDSNHRNSTPIVLHPAGELTGSIALPFAVDLPLAPLSYVGTLIKINWLFRVRIDRPWALDMKHDERIIVV